MTEVNIAASPGADTIIESAPATTAAHDNTSEETMAFLQERGLLNDSDDSSEDEAPKEEAAEASDVESEEAPEEAEEKAEKDAPAKILKLKVDGKDIDVPDTTTLEVKVDGKVEKVSIADLKKDYAGRVAYDKKFQELDVMKKEFEGNVKTLDHKLNDVFKTMKKDGEAGLKKLFKMAKRDDYDQFIDGLRAEYEKSQQLTPAERELEKKAKALAAKEEELNEIENSKHTQAQLAEIDAYATSLMTKHGVTVQEFQQAATAIQKAYAPEDLDKMSAKELVERAVQVVGFDRDLKLIDSVISKADSTKLEDKAFRKDVIDVLTSAKLEVTDENVSFVVNGLLGNSRKENSTKAATTAKPGATSEETNAENKEEDLGDLVRGFWS